MIRRKGQRIQRTGLDYVLLQGYLLFGLPLFSAVGLQIVMLGTEIGPYPDSLAAFWLVPVLLAAMGVRWWGWMGIWVEGDEVVVRNMLRTVRLPVPVRAFKEKACRSSLDWDSCVVLGSVVTTRRCKAVATGGSDREALRALDEAGLLDGSWRENVDRMRGFSGG